MDFVRCLNAIRSFYGILISVFFWKFYIISNDIFGSGLLGDGDLKKGYFLPYSISFWFGKLKVGD